MSQTIKAVNDPAVLETALVIGGSGMLGQAWVNLLKEQGVEHDALSRPDIDLADEATLERALDHRYRYVINCAAWTDVDGAEKDEAGATQINGDAVGRLAEGCKAINATLIHYSTDYVFNGSATEPYPIDAPIDPINAYGRSKAVGERLLLESGCRHLLIRTSWVYAPWGRNFVRTMASLARERPSLRVVNDQHGRPTSAEHLARMSMGLASRGLAGTFHVTDGDECTWHGLAREVIGRINPAVQVQDCTSSEYPRPAKRPSYSVLDISKTEAVLGPMPNWRSNVADVLQRMT